MRIIPWSQDSKLISNPSNTDITSRRYFRSLLWCRTGYFTAVQKTINWKHCSCYIYDIWPYIKTKLHGKILQKSVSLAISSSVAQEVEDSTLDKGTEAETSASDDIWADFPSAQMLMAWPGQVQLCWEHNQTTKTQKTEKNNNFCLEQLREQQASWKSASQSGTAMAAGKVSVQQYPLPPIIFNVGNP